MPGSWGEHRALTPKTGLKTKRTEGHGWPQHRPPSDPVPRHSLLCAPPSDAAGGGGLTENSIAQQKREPRIREANSQPRTHSKLPALLGWPFFSTPTSPGILPDAILADCQVQAAPASHPQFLRL